MGLSDLLPPSPSVAVHQGRQFPPASTFAPSSFSTYPVDVNPDNGPLSLSSSKKATSSHRNQQMSRRNLSPEHTTSNEDMLRHHSLDYSALISEDAHNLEINRTVKVLAHWLATIESGLNTMLDNAIEEENDADFGDSAYMATRTEVEGDSNL